MKTPSLLLAIALLLPANVPGAAAAGSAAKSVKPTATGQDAPAARWAILVGVGRYEDDSIAALSCSNADVRALQEVLVDARRGAFAQANVVTLTDDATDAKLRPTRLNILARLRAWSAIAGPNDTLLFFFSGHGIAEKGKGYLLPSDARIGILSDSAVPTERVDEILAESRAKCTLVVLDACHSAAGKDLAVMSEEMSQELFSDADGRVTMASCQENQQSFEWKEKGQSVYTYFLIDGLRGAGDTNGDGAVTVTELNTYTHDKVTRWAAENGRQQKPRARMNISGDIVLTQAAAATPAGGTAPAPTPLLLPATLQVRSKPSGARVLLDGQEKGQTGCEFQVTDVTGKPRKHRVVVEMAGYRSQGLELELAGGEVVPLDVELAKVPEPVATGTDASPAGGAGATPLPGGAAAAPVPAGGGTPFPGGTTATPKPSGGTPFPGETAAGGRAQAGTAAGTGASPFDGVPLSPRWLVTVIKMLDTPRSRCPLTRGQKEQLERILSKVQQQRTISLEQAQAVQARVRSILTEEQKAELHRLLTEAGKGQRPGADGRPALGTRPGTEAWGKRPTPRPLPARRRR